MLMNRIGIFATNYRQIRFSSTGREKLVANCKRFQLDDGCPVYLKGGHTDKFLFQGTVLLCLCGLIDGGMTLFKMARPKKKN